METITSGRCQPVSSSALWYSRRFKPHSPSTYPLAYRFRHLTRSAQFISVHVRRTDFEGGCYGVTKDECFAPLSAYERRVREVRERLRNRTNGANVKTVIVTSDERDPKWWSQVSTLGSEWGWIDHAAEQTAEKYGKWYVSKLLTRPVVY
jgi:hypothetical protein